MLARAAFSRTSLKHAATPWGMTTSIVGFASDVLKPSVDLPPILLAVSLVGLIIALLIFLKKTKSEGLEAAKESSVTGFVTFFALSILAWGGITLAFHFTPPQGVAASNIPSIEEFQRNVLKIGKDVEEVKKGVERIEQKIDELAKTGTVISNPKRPEEFYHNAKFYELKGNNTEAQKAYEKFLELAPDYIDAHLAYQTLMNNTQGIEATRQTYANLQLKYPNNPVVALMAIRLNPDRNQRLEQLKLLMNQHPNIGPISFELAQEYLRPGPGNVTIDELKNAKEAFERFKKADAAGTVKSFYIDKKVLEEVYKKRDEFGRLANAAYGQMIDRPLVIDAASYERGGSTITFIPRERGVQKIFYSIDDPNPTIDTGSHPEAKDPTTGLPLPNYVVQGRIAVGKHTIYAKYINAQGKESPVLSIPFEVPLIKARVSVMPNGELGSAKKNIKIVFFSLDGKRYDFFYGVNTQSPTQKVLKNSILLEGVNPTDEIFYFGISEGVKTPVYSLRLSKSN